MAKRKAADIAADMEVLRAELVELDAAEEPTDEQVTRAQAALGEFEALEALRAEAEQYEQRMEVVRNAALQPQNIERGSFQAPQVIIKDDPFEVLRSRGVGLSDKELSRALVDGMLHANEDRIEDNANQAHFEKIVKRHGGDHRWASGLLARSRPEYESAWSKLMTGQTELLDEVERASLSVGSNTNGGFLVPTHLDPTVILTNSGTSNVIRGMSRVVTLTEGSVWNGVSSAGVTASWDAELTEVSEDSPTFGRVSITAYKAQSLVQASIESFQDIGGLSSDVLMMFADARDRLEGAAHATGTGSQPQGIFTALDANTNVELTSTTAATIGLVDLHTVYRSVPVRWRGRSSWLMNPEWSLAIKALGTALSASYSTDITQSMAGSLLGRPLVESDDAPNVATTTALDNRIVLGDFSNFVIVDKPGSMSVEFIPHLFNTTTNLPDGRRGWYAHWRTGSDSVNDLAFRLLQDKTSA